MGYCVDEMRTMRARLLENVQPQVDILVVAQTRAAVIDAVAMNLRYIADNFVEPQIRAALGEEDLLRGNNLLRYIRSTLPTAGVLLQRLAVHGVSLMLGGDDALLTLQFRTNVIERGHSSYLDILKSISDVRTADRGAESTTTRF